MTGKHFQIDIHQTETSENKTKLIHTININTREISGSQGASMKMRAFWDNTPCNLVKVDRRFRSAYYLNHKGDGPNNDPASTDTYTSQLLYRYHSCLHRICSTRLHYAEVQKAVIFNRMTPSYHESVLKRETTFVGNIQK
jgi:hypothetical protein